MQHISFKDLAERSSLSPESIEQLNEELNHSGPVRKSGKSSNKLNSYLQQQASRIAQLEAHLSQLTQVRDEVAANRPVIEKTKQYDEEERLKVAKFIEDHASNGNYDDVTLCSRFSKIIKKETGVPSGHVKFHMDSLNRPRRKITGYWHYTNLILNPDIDEKYDDEGKLLPLDSDGEDFDFPDEPEASGISPPPNFV